MHDSSVFLQTGSAKATSQSLAPEVAPSRTNNIFLDTMTFTNQIEHKGQQNKLLCVPSCTRLISPGESQERLWRRRGGGRGPVVVAVVSDASWKLAVLVGGGGVTTNRQTDGKADSWLCKFSNCLLAKISESFSFKIPNPINGVFIFRGSLFLYSALNLFCQV